MQHGKRAMILFAHGARDPLWRVPFEQVHRLVQEQSGSTPVLLAFLELMQPDLQDAVQLLVQQGCTDLLVVPLFLGQGGHVRRDLPELVKRLQGVHPQLMLRIAPAAGEDDAVLHALADYCVDAGARVVMDVTAKR